MQVSLFRRSRRRPAVLAAVVIIAGLVSVPTIGAQAKPVNPTDGQISSAAAQKAALADQVGQLNAQVAAIKTQLQQKQAQAELAEQKYAYAMQKLGEANDAAAKAQAKLKSANQTVQSARADFRYYIQTVYASGNTMGLGGSLLTAQDPNALLESNALRDYEAQHQLDAISKMQSASVGKSNAEAQARVAVAKQKQAAANANQARKDAEDAVQIAQQQEQDLQSTLGTTEAQLTSAQEQLATLNHQRAVFIAYQVHQAYLRHQAYLKHQAELKRARELEAERERKLKLERERERERQRQQHSGGGSGGGSSSGGGGSSTGGGGGGGSSTPIAPTGGGWTAAKGETAVQRASDYLGYMYAWAGGNAYGPTRGVCAGDGAWNDCHITGFDCSGLTLYAWAPYKTLDHYSVSQYYSAGSYHPSIGNLRPGDLVFWSSNGSVSGIHHVAIYIGGGTVIQAPQSGSVIQKTALGSVSWGYYGATRPLT